MEQLMKDLEAIENGLAEIEKFRQQTMTDSTLSEESKEMCYKAYDRCDRSSRDRLAILNAKIQLAILNALTK